MLLRLTGILSGFVILIGACNKPINTNIPHQPLEFTVSQQDEFYLPPELEVTLWAESPLFYNPTNMDVDARGRIWLTEAVNYRDFNNKVEDHLHFEQGDRVIILEDTDGDGKCDSSKVFVQDKDLRAPLGIAVIGKQVVVSASPHMIIYTDEDGDDKPDKKEVFLTGFGGYDHDHSLHALVVGPDGKWYFNTGNAGPHHVKDKSGWTLRSGSNYTGGTPYNLENEGNQKSDDGRIWVGGLALTINPDGTGLSVIGHNFRNAYELALDSYGNVWQNDNDDQVVSCRVSYVMEGGNAGYFSEDGTRNWQADRKPRQSIPSAHWHQEDPGVIPAGDISGAGSPTGFMVYEGDALGENFDEMLISVEAGRNVLFAYRPAWKGAGFAFDRKDLFTNIGSSTEDYKWNEIFEDKRRWFRPSDAVAGTDGSIYIADWYDPVVGGHQMHDQAGYGRIYRITPKGKKLPLPTIDLESTEGQIEALQNPAIHLRALAFSKLKEKGEAVLPAVSQLLNHPKSYIQARAIWLMAELGDPGKKEVETLLKNHKDPRLRVVAYRALEQKVDDISKLALIAVSDPSPAVRKEVAISLRDKNWEVCKDIFLSLVQQLNPDDPYEVAALGIGAENKEAALYASLLQVYPSDPIEWSPSMAKMAWLLHPVSSANALITRAEASDILSFAERKSAVDALAFIKDRSAALHMRDLALEGPEDIQSLARWWTAHRSSNDWIAWKDELRLPESGGHSEMSDYLADIQNSALEEKDSDEEVQRISLEAVANLTGDPIQGKELTQQRCLSCHTIDGEGQLIGPDLTQINTKFDKAALLDAIINPSAAIGFGYEPYLIEKKNGNILYGFLVGKGKTRMLKDLAGNQHVIPPEEIEREEALKVSVMPEPESMGLDEQGVADITQYLLRLPSQ